MSKYAYFLSLLVLTCAIRATITDKDYYCDTNIQETIIASKVYGANALTSFVDSANKTTILSITSHVQLWQRGDSGWENIAALKPVCEPQTAQVIVNPETNQPVIVVGAGSCFSISDTKGVFVVWQEEESVWKVTSSAVVSSGQPFTYIDAFFTNTTSSQPVVAAGYSNQTVLFFESNGEIWQEVSSLERVVKSFYVPGYGQCAVSQSNSDRTQLEFWLYNGSTWELAQSFNIGEDAVYAADYMMLDGLPTVVVGTGLGELITAQLQNGKWLFSKQSFVGSILDIAHIQEAERAYLLIPGEGTPLIYIYQRVNNSWQIFKRICPSGSYMQGAVGGFVDENSGIIAVASYGDMYCNWIGSCNLGLFDIGNVTTDS